MGRGLSDQPVVPSTGRGGAPRVRDDTAHAYAVAARPVAGRRCAGGGLRPGGGATVCGRLVPNAKGIRSTRCIKASSRSGTDQPVYPPWYMGDDARRRRGLRIAGRLRRRGKLGYARDDVRWVRVPFNAALAPGPKSSTPACPSSRSPTSARPRSTSRRRISTSRRPSSRSSRRLRRECAASRTQAAAARRPGRHDQLHGGHRGGRRTRSPSTTPTATRRLALSTGEIDALVADLPTAFAVANELRDGLIVGQLPTASGDVERSGSCSTRAAR